MTRLLQLVADYGPGELRFAELVQRLALVAPELTVCATRVAPADTLAAGLCVAELALSTGPDDRIVIGDVDGAPRDARLWIGHTHDGVRVVAPECGSAWSFIAAELSELCALDVPAGADVALAVRHALGNHPHAIRGVVDRTRVPAPPECVLVWTDRAGNLQTTLVTPPDERVLVHIGDCREPASLGDGRRRPDEGELVLEPGTRGLQRIRLGGGSAADRFDRPPAGAPVTVTSAGRRRRPAAQRTASPAVPQRP